MAKKLALASITLIAALSLAGCATAAVDDATETAPSTPVASSTPTAEAEPTETAEEEPSEEPTEPSVDGLIEGTGYVFMAPEGWSVPAELPSGGPITPDTYVSEGGVSAGGSGNMNVLRSPAGLVPLDTVEASASGELEAVGAVDIVQHPRVSVAGGEASHVSSSVPTAGAAIEQFYLNDDVTYIVTFTFIDSMTEDERAAIYEPVMDSWEWR